MQDFFQKIIGYLYGLTQMSLIKLFNQPSTLIQNSHLYRDGPHIKSDVHRRLIRMIDFFYYRLSRIANIPARRMWHKNLPSSFTVLVVALSGFRFVSLTIP